MALTYVESDTYAIARNAGWAYPQGSVSTLGKNIARLRREAGHKNATAFARSIGITAATLKDWESGRYENLRIDSLLRVARGVPCKIDDLLVGVDEAYDEIVITKTKQSDENNPPVVTYSDRDRGVQGTERVRETYAHAPRGSHDDAEAAPVRSPIDLAARIAQEAINLRASADRLDGLAGVITDRFTDGIIGPPHTTAGLDADHQADPPATSTRPPGRRHGGEQ